MSWDEIKSSILTPCGNILEPHGYKFVNSRHAYEKKLPLTRLGVYFTLVASHHENYSAKVWCGIRVHAIEDIFHRTSGVDKRAASTYVTLNIACDTHWWLNTKEEQAKATFEAQAFVRNQALPFLEKEYSVQDYSDMLNAQPSGRCPFHGNRENRCHYALIAAKLAGDRRFDELKLQYSEFLRTSNNGFYFARFEKFLKDIE